MLVLWPFLWDGGFTLLNRVYHRRNPFRPHRSHLYQRLSVTGMSHKAITLRYALAMVACARRPAWLDSGATRCSCAGARR